MNRNPLVILQVSDLHFLTELGGTMEGVDTEHSFTQIIEHIHNTYPQIDLLLVTGDLTQDPYLPNYQRINKILKKYDTRTICLPGNHDDFELMQQVFTTKQINCNKLIKFNDWQVISLNSQIIDSAKGRLTSIELNFLSNALDENPDLYSLIALHHHCIPTKSTWMDTMLIENSDDFFALLADYPQVKAISCGHIHQEVEEIKEGKLILGAPSTCFQFKPLSADYALDNKQPGYRVFSLYSNGVIESEVHYLS